MKICISFLLLSLLIACQPRVPATQTATTTLNKFSDTTLQRIYTYQDERKPEALLPYLKHKKSNYRQEAALALASVQAPNTRQNLLALLQDPEPVVRRAAAYALGQLSDTTVAFTLQQMIITEKNASVRAELAEALGKCATQKSLHFLSSQNWLNETEKAGVAWGLYRTNAKKLDYSLALTQAVKLLAATNSPATRLGAAHFLARTPNLALAGFEANILAAAQSDTSAAVRMAAAQALGKINTTAAKNGLLGLVQSDPDYRVRINAIRALSNADFSSVKNIIYQALADKNVNTALTAADYLVAKAPNTEAQTLLQTADKTANWRVKATLLGATLKNHPDKTLISQKIKNLYAASVNIYKKGALLAALGQDINNYTFIQQETFSAGSPVLATYGLQALADLRQQKNFPTALIKPFAEIFRQALQSDDIALIGIAAGLLTNPDLGFKTAFPDPAFLKEVQAKLTLPSDMETYQELDKAIRYLSGLPPAAAPANPFTHPINWQLVRTLKPNQQVSITTGKGNITLTLFTEAAPGTVANFVQLAQAGFFNQKNFHRVVPNFVVQGGDPRGDGWGGTDYAIRSELANLRYHHEGYVGMASAGKDTESCQWFITHSPTPHLDGRYTIFAQVTAGMAVVHQLEVGDIIQSVKLIN